VAVGNLLAARWCPKVYSKWPRRFGPPGGKAGRGAAAPRCVKGAQLSRQTGRTGARSVVGAVGAQVLNSHRTVPQSPSNEAQRCPLLAA